MNISERGMQMLVQEAASRLPVAERAPALRAVQRMRTARGERLREAFHAARPLLAELVVVLGELAAWCAARRP